MKRATLAAVMAFALACLLLGAACSLVDYKNDELCNAGCQKEGFSGGNCKTPDEGAGKSSIGACTDTQGPCSKEGACKCYCG